MLRSANERWTVGAVEIVRLVEIAEVTGINDRLFANCSPQRVLSHPWLVPHYATPSGQLKMCFQAFALKAGARRILVDTCIGADKPRMSPLFNRLQSRFLQDLGDAGFDPDSVDTVLCTHLHHDHVGWNTRWTNGHWIPTFPAARYLFGREEWEHARAMQPDGRSELGHVKDSLEPVVRAGLVDFVTAPHRVCSEVSLEPSPGHTPGHACVRIESQGEVAVITGDLMHHPLQCAEPELSSNFCADPERARRTRREFLERYGERRALVIGSHFCTPSAGWIVRDAAGWRFEGG